MAMGSSKWWVIGGVLLVVLGSGGLIRAQNGISPSAIITAQAQYESPVVQVQWASSEVLWVAEQSGRIWAWNLTTTEQSVVWSGRGWIGGFIPVENGFITWRNPPYTCTDVCDSEIELETGAVLRHPGRLQTADLHPDANFLLTTATDGYARIWSLPSGNLVAEIAAVGVNGAAWNRDGSQVVVWDRAGMARVFAANASETPIRALDAGGWIADARFVGDQLLTVGADGHITLWNADDVLALAIRSRAVLGGGSTNPDGSLILVWGRLRRGVFEVWTRDGGRNVLQVPTDAEVRAAAFDPSETQIVLSDASDRVQVWLLPNPDACYVTTTLAGVNQRSAPDTNATIGGRLAPNEVRLAVGVTQGADGFRWWQLQDETWVRDDVITTTGACSSLPVVE